MTCNDVSRELVEMKYWCGSSTLQREST